MSRARPSVEELADGIRSGDRSILARAITLAESKRRDDQKLIQQLLVELLPETGAARRIGLTGVPGAGKSTTIEALGTWLIERGHRVAVLAIDPSSSRAGGSILGDKTRMQKLSLSPDAFVRPSPTSGVLGGVGRRTREALMLCEAAGFDVVIVESVGVGQSEALMSEIVDCFCLLLVPGAGDELQGIKRGIIEMADLVVVNKADGDRVNLAKRAAGDYRHALRLLPESTPGWKTPVIIASATEGTGLEALWENIEEHRAHLEESGLLDQRRRDQQLGWLRSLVEEAVLAAFRDRDGVPAALEAARRAVVAEEVTVPQAVADVMAAAGEDRSVVL